MVQRAFFAYLKAVETAFEVIKLQPRSKDDLLELHSKTDQLRAMVEKLERGREFEDLLKATRSKFGNGWHSGKSELLWRHATHNFFCRCGYYTGAPSEPFSAPTLLQTYEEAFQRRHVKTTFLSPMEFVSFPEALRFSEFEIRKFDSDELDSIVGNDINRIFYPYAVLDTGVLHGYWFLIVRVQQEAPRLGMLNINLNDIGRISPEYSHLPSAIKRVLMRLILFDWVVEPDDDHLPYGSQFGFNLPFVITVNEDELRGPIVAPDCSKLTMDLRVDPYTEEEYETPIVLFELSESKTLELKKSIERTDKSLRLLEADRNRWPFLKVAFGNLIKAFFADGLEQLLWHITALEAFLGEQKQGIATSLARRTAAILGTTAKERKKLRKQFDELYDLRCDMVHGNQFKRDAQWHQLFQARAFARRVTIWFIHYLGMIAAKLNEGLWPGDVPKREDLLNLLDLSDQDRNRLKVLINNLPTGFPKLSGDLDDK